jgi:hypothetical protein
MSRSSVVYDVENKLIVQALARKYKDSEQSMALEHIEYVSELLAGRRCLLLFDRGYPSLALLACLASKKLDYVLRCHSDFIAEVAAFAQSPLMDAKLCIEVQTKSRQKNEALQAWLQPGQKQLELRAVKIMLQTGETEYLLTSLQEHPLAIFQLLYHKRWDVETGFNFQKNDLQLENFSARTVIGIQQDYHARILTANLTSLLIADAQAQLQAQQPLDHNYKYHYQINRAVALGLVKDKLPDLLMNVDSLQQVYDQLIQKIKRRKVAIKPFRKFPRKIKLHYKFKANRRPVL